MASEFLHLGLMLCCDGSEAELAALQEVARDLAARSEPMSVAWRLASTLTVARLASDRDLRQWTEQDIMDRIRANHSIERG